MATEHDPRLESPAENWGDYELWEKIEIRIRRRKRWVIAGAVFLFLLLSAVPVVMDRQPRWCSYRAARGLTQIFSSLKTRAAADGVAYRIIVAPDLSLQTERALNEAVRCADQATGRWTNVDTSADAVQRAWRERAVADGVVLLPIAKAQELGLDRATDRFCYDPVALPIGPQPTVQADGIGLLPHVDLESGRLDRAVVIGWHDAASEFSLD